LNDLTAIPLFNELEFAALGIRALDGEHHRSQSASNKDLL